MAGTAASLKRGWVAFRVKQFLSSAAVLPLKNPGERLKKNKKFVVGEIARAAEFFL